MVRTSGLKYSILLLSCNVSKGEHTFGSCMEADVTDKSSSIFPPQLIEEALRMHASCSRSLMDRLEGGAERFGFKIPIWIISL